MSAGGTVSVFDALLGSFFGAQDSYAFSVGSQICNSMYPIPTQMAASDLNFKKVMTPPLDPKYSPCDRWTDLPGWRET